MNLTEREKEIFDVIKRRKEIKLDELLDKFRSDTVNQKNARHAMIVRMKYLSAKVAPYGWIITKTSGVGSGVKAVYSVEKRF